MFNQHVDRAFLARPGVGHEFREIDTKLAGLTHECFGADSARQIVRRSPIRLDQIDLAWIERPDSLESLMDVDLFAIWSNEVHCDAPSIQITLYVTMSKLPKEIFGAKGRDKVPPVPGGRRRGEVGPPS